MKPFVLEEALAGAKVMNGKQNPVTDIAYFPSIIGPYRVFAVIDGRAHNFTVTGRISNESPNPLLDLFMAPVKSEGWINIYKSGYKNGYIYNTEEEARVSGGLSPIACIRIEWEE
jgi:hypothetical protein